MNNQNLFRNKQHVARTLERIHAKATRIQVSFMEVCGTHTMAVSEYGLRSLFPKNIRLISGPGCPVCVTPNSCIDRAVAIAKRRDCIVATFGDMMRVPGSSTSLREIKSLGSDVRVVYSTIDALKIAQDNPQKKVIFIGVGFETTAPTIAASVINAQRQKIRNYYILCAHKTMPSAMEALVKNKKIAIDGFICPGHVSAIIGSKPYEFLAERYGKACVIAGFEPLDICRSVEMLLDQVHKRKYSVEIQYTRAVKPEGNPAAVKAMYKVFEPCTSEWRGIGFIDNSGLRFNETYRDFDVETAVPVEPEPLVEHKYCICGDVLQGLKLPMECMLFGTECIPEHPIGACMVSSEGACAAYYKYGS